MKEIGVLMTCTSFRQCDFRNLLLSPYTLTVDIHCFPKFRRLTFLHRLLTAVFYVLTLDVLTVIIIPRQRGFHEYRPLLLTTETYDVSLLLITPSTATDDNNDIQERVQLLAVELLQTT
jgi:hypothetical protein